MSNSQLVSVYVPADKGNYTRGRYDWQRGSETEIQEITIHHMAGIASAEDCGRIFATVGRYGSSHYGIGNDGEVGQYVNEEDTAWTNSNWDSNLRAVTIETSNCERGGDWRVSDAALNSLISLVADIAKRNGLYPLVKGENLTWHQMYAATACPGPYLLSKMDYIVEEANKKIIEKTEEEDDMTIERFEELWREMRKSLQDNDNSSWSQDGREWAISNGLIQGGDPLPDGSPNYMWNDLLTREQMVVLLYRFAQMMGKA